MCHVDVTCDRTGPGEKVALIGASQALGGWDVSRALRLETSANSFPIWSGEVPNSPVGTEFKMIILRSDDTARDWESGVNRSWPQVADGMRLSLSYDDRFNLDTRVSSDDRYAKATVTQVTCHVSVVCDMTRPGEVVALIGSTPTLGSWDVSRALRLQTSAHNFPTWSGEVTSVPIGTEFKAIIIDACHSARDWEAGENRSWPSVADGMRFRLTYGIWDSIRVERDCNVAASPLERLSRSSEDLSVSQDPPKETLPLEINRFQRASIVKRPSELDVANPRTTATNIRSQSRGNGIEIELRSSRLYWGDDTPALTTKASPTPRALLHSRFIVDNEGDITDVYDVRNDIIGEGSFAKVFIGTNRMTGAVRAIKKIPRCRLADPASFSREVDTMKLMDHPNVLKLFETFEDKNSVCMVMELCSGGDLFDKLAAARRFSEQISAVVMRQIFSGVYYIHSRLVCHRDLKLENFLFVSKTHEIEHNALKIIDFGLSCPCAPGQRLTTRCGTPSYVSPEVLEGDYDLSADIWSCGVIMYALLIGKLPFDNGNEKDTMQAIRRGIINLDKSRWESISKKAQELILCLLKRARMRCSLMDALGDAWILERSCSPSRLASGIGEMLFTNLRSSTLISSFKKAVRQLIIWRFGPNEQLESLTEAFQALDSNGDGVLTAAEFADGLRSQLQNIPPNFDDIVEGWAVNVSGEINYTEFLAATLDTDAYLDDKNCQRAFRVLDKDRDGKLSVDEINTFIENTLEEQLEQCAARNLVRDADTDGDGFIDLEEFTRMLRQDGI